MIPGMADVPDPFVTIAVPLSTRRAIDQIQHELMRRDPEHKPKLHVVIAWAVDALAQNEKIKVELPVLQGDE